jgi:D-alanyl-D-alanine carboxypeptidase
MVRATVKPTRLSATRRAIRAILILTLVVLVAPSTMASPAAPAADPSLAPSAASPSPIASRTQPPTAVRTDTPTAVPTTPPAVPSRSSPVYPVPAGPVVEIPTSGIAMSATDATRKALTSRLGTLRSTYGLPGVSAAILFPDGTMWRATSGFAEVATRRRLTADTEFAIASISKTFLAALILRLVEEGKVGLDTAVAPYLPDVVIDPGITVRQLLDHTSGLHDYFYDPDIDADLLGDRTRAWTATEALGYVGKPYFEPGAGWHYSNTNYVILGLLAESVEGVPLAEQFRTRFLAPFGLDHTHYQGVEKPLGPLARAYRFSGPGLRLKPIPLSDGTNVVPFTSVVTAAGSAGSLASTPDDLVTWARALYGGSVLSPASLAAMVGDVSFTAAFKPSIPYGLGVQAATVDGRPTLGHSGRLLGSRTVMRWLPDQGIAIAVLTNQSRNDPNLVARALLRVVLGTPLECTSCASVQ